MKKTYITKIGLLAFEKELDLLTKRRKASLLELQRTRELGDLSENSAYRAAKQAVTTIDRRIRHLKYILRTSKVYEPTNNGTIQIGSKFTILLDNEEYEYTLVGTFETDISNKQISIHSPIGKGVLGKRKSDVIHIQTPAGNKQCIITKVDTP